MAYVIIGATGGLGRALGERLAAAGRALVLVARDQAALDALAADLRAHFNADVATVAADVEAGPGYLDQVAGEAEARDGLEGLLLPLGLSVRDDVNTKPAMLRTIAHVNFLAVVEAVTVLWPRLAAAGGVVAGFGSVTAVRGRGRNFVYGAAKRALAAYFESLRVIAGGAGIRVQFWTVGFLASDAMKDEATPVPKGDPGHLAARVVARLDRGSFARWYPGWWRWVAVALKCLPWSLYARFAAGRK